MSLLTDYLFHSNKYHSDRIAIELPNESLTYRDLYNSSAKIAHTISANTSIDENHICICLPKNAPLYTSIFGVLLSGKCYVPVNYHIPSARLKYIIEDSSSSLLITNWSKLKKLAIDENFTFAEEYNFEQSEVVIAKISKNNERNLLSIITTKIDQSSEISFSDINSDSSCYIL
ncbi:MAG: AMP-binding protein, partial [Gammaproteobacteria bacterium]